MMKIFRNKLVVLVIMLSFGMITGCEIKVKTDALRCCGCKAAHGDAIDHNSNY